MFEAGAHNVRRALATSEKVCEDDAGGRGSISSLSAQRDINECVAKARLGQQWPGVSYQCAVIVCCPSVRTPVAIAARKLYATRAPLCYLSICVAPNRHRDVCHSIIVELKIQPKSPVSERSFFFSLCAVICVYWCSLSIH